MRSLIQRRVVYDVVLLHVRIRIRLQAVSHQLSHSSLLLLQATFRFIYVVLARACMQSACPSPLLQMYSMMVQLCSTIILQYLKLKLFRLLAMLRLQFYHIEFSLPRSRRLYFPAIWLSGPRALSLYQHSCAAFSLLVALCWGGLGIQERYSLSTQIHTSVGLVRFNQIYY